MLNFSEFQDYALMTIPERLPEEYKGVHADHGNGRLSYTGRQGKPDIGT